MTRSPRNVTDAELQVLKVLWEQGPSTIRQLTDVLYPAGQTSHYATVQKLLERLDGKRCVARRARGRANVYRATVDRDDLIADGLRDTAERLCDGSLAPLLTHLVGSARLDRREVARLRKLVAELEGDGRRGEPGKA